MGILGAMQSATVALPRRQPADRLLLISALLCLPGICAQADTGKLRLTGGVSTIEGAAGGGLTPWALFRAQNQLLALLAPMHRDIITR